MTLVPTKQISSDTDEQQDAIGVPHRELLTEEVAMYDSWMLPKRLAQRHSNRVGNAAD